MLRGVREVCENSAAREWTPFLRFFEVSQLGVGKMKSVGLLKKSGGRYRNGVLGIRTTSAADSPGNGISVTSLSLALEFSTYRNSNLSSTSPSVLVFVSSRVKTIQGMIWASVCRPITVNFSFMPKTLMTSFSFSTS